MARRPGERGVCALCAWALFASAWTLACSSDDESEGDGSGSGGTAGNISIGTGGTSAGGTGNTGNTGPYVLPPDFTDTEWGGYKLGNPFDGESPPGNVGTGGSSGAGSENGCNTILAVVRDFKGADESGGHPDFQSFDGDAETPGMVEGDLGTDSKPVYTGICEAANAGNQMLCPHQQQSTSAGDFASWYNFAQDINRPYVLHLSFEPNDDVFTFQSDLFFPLDDAGWGNSGTGQDDQEHNFHFTTEVHTEFRYSGGETFTFIGDDDVWVFINKKLAVDLGGLHPEETGSIDLDARAGDLGITRGNVYPLDLFHAERHTSASNFRVDTNLVFTNCGIIVPENPR